MVNSTTQYFDKEIFSWWNTITVGDFNTDGRPDLIIGEYGFRYTVQSFEKNEVDVLQRL